MIQTNFKWILLAAVLGLAFGYYLAPEKVKIETKIVEVEKKTTDKDTHKDTKITQVKAPDGTVTTVTTTTEDNKTIILDDKSVKTDTLKETTKSSNHTNFALLAGIPISLSGGSVLPVYGAEVSGNLLGPITIGGWAMSNKTAGLSVGISF